MTGDAQFRQHIALIITFTLGVAIGGFCADIVLNPQSEATAAYTARVDYWSAMDSNGRDRCPGKLPAGTALLDVR